MSIIFLHCGVTCKIAFMYRQTFKLTDIYGKKAQHLKPSGFGAPLRRDKPIKNDSRVLSDFCLCIAQKSPFLISFSSPLSPFCHLWEMV